MRNKRLYLIPLISAGAFAPLSGSAAPLISIGDNTDVFFNGSSSLRWQSNVFRDEDDEDSDLLWTVSPGLEVNVGRGLTNADLSVITRYDILTYDDNSDLDTELFHIKAIGAYKSGRLDLNGSVAFDEEQSTSGDVNAAGRLIESDNVRARLGGEFQLSPKFSIGNGLSYVSRDYDTIGGVDRFADYEEYRLSTDVFYELTPKVDLSLGHSYSERDVDDTDLSLIDYTTESHFYNVGLRGDLLPKLTGFFKVGYRTFDNDRPGSDDDGMLGLDGDLTWATTPKLTTKLAFSQDFGTGGEGQSTENFNVNASANYTISSYFSASGNVGYTNRDYTNTGREDDQYDIGVRLSYVPNQYWRFSTGYTYSENDSNRDQASYDNHIIDLSASLRY